MKKPLIVIALSTIVIFFGMACKKSFFDAAPDDGSVSDATAYKTKADFDAGVVGAYVSLQSAFDTWIKMPGWLSQDIFNSERVETIDQLMDPNNGQISEYWTELYKIVNNSNIVISKLASIEPGILTDEEFKKASGQVRFLRGMSYLQLTRTFGDIPMPLTGYSATQNNIACTSSDEVMTQVIIDLKEAAAQLPETKKWTGADIGRVGKGAAQAYLALAYMYKKDWTNAAVASEQLLALRNPQYVLFPNVRTVFSALNKNLNESIFEIQFSLNSVDKWVGWGGQAPSNGHTTVAQTAPPVGEKFAPYGGWGNYIVSPIAVASFEPGDNRRKQLLVKYPEPYKGELMADTMRDKDWDLDKDGKVKLFPANRKAYGYSTKYWFGPSGMPYGSNIICMRFADFKLNYAEILFNQNKTNEAYQQLNDVRVRAGLPAKTTSADMEVFMTALMNEKRHELLLEPNLWWNYTRTGRAAKFLKDNYNITMLEKWNHFPTPQRERDVNPNLCSNGY